MSDQKMMVEVIGRYDPRWSKMGRSSLSGYQRHRASSETSVIVLTARNAPLARAEDLDLGADDYPDGPLLSGKRRTRGYDQGFQFERAAVALLPGSRQ